MCNAPKLLKIDKPMMAKDEVNALGPGDFILVSWGGDKPDTLAMIVKIDRYAEYIMVIHQDPTWKVGVYHDQVVCLVQKAAWPRIGE